MVLTLRGVMAVAPLGGDPAAAFGEARRRALSGSPGSSRSRRRSAGMSEDLEAAVKAGATHLRVGTALSGDRPRSGNLQHEPSGSRYTYQRRSRLTMAGAMRKMGVYLGLVEDEGAEG